MAMNTCAVDQIAALVISGGRVNHIVIAQILHTGNGAAPAPAASAAPAAGEQICAPMPGNILAVNVTAGQTVKKGDVLMVLEAMKMENEIMCPRDGVVASVNTSKGASVESGTLLCVLQ